MFGKSIDHRMVASDDVKERGGRKERGGFAWPVAKKSGYVDFAAYPRQPTAPGR
jgi:hypothetical protein